MKNHLYFLNYNLMTFFLSFFIKNNKPKFNFENILFFYTKIINWSSVFYKTNPVLLKISNKTSFCASFNYFFKSFYNLVQILFFYLNNNFFFFIFSNNHVMKNFFNLFSYNYNYFSYGNYSRFFKQTTKNVRHYASYSSLYEFFINFNIRCVVISEINPYRHSLTLLKKMNFLIIGLISSHQFSNYFDYVILVKKLNSFVAYLFFNFITVFYFTALKQQYFVFLLNYCILHHKNKYLYFK